MCCLNVHSLFNPTICFNFTVFLTITYVQVFFEFYKLAEKNTNKKLIKKMDLIASKLPELSTEYLNIY